MKKQKKGFKLPQRSLLLYLLLIFIPVLIFFLIAIPVLYVNEYKENKAEIFKTDLENVTDVIYADASENPIKDFNLFLYCTSYNNTTGAIEFKTILYENDTTSSVIKDSDQVSIKLGMYSDWIKVESTASNRSRKIASTPKEALGSSSYYATYSISGIPTLPKKGGLPFINIKSIPVYAYVTYTTTVKGSKTTKRYVIKYEYSEYMIDRTTFDAGTSNEAVIVPTTGGIN